MISYEEVQTVVGPFGAGNPFEAVLEFYRTNGYEVRDVSRHGDEDDPVEQQAILDRGALQQGWWSSNTATLPTEVEVVCREDELELTYRVENAGQPLTENDRKFWRREMRTAINQTRNPKRRPLDLRHEAAKHAEHLRRRLLSYGIWVVIALLGFVVVVNVFTTGGSA